MSTPQLSFSGAVVPLSTQPLQQGLGLGPGGGGGGGGWGCKGLEWETGGEQGRRGRLCGVYCQTLPCPGY